MRNVDRLGSVTEEVDPAAVLVQAKRELYAELRQLHETAGEVLDQLGRGDFESREMAHRFLAYIAGHTYAKAEYMCFRFETDFGGAIDDITARTEVSA